MLEFECIIIGTNPFRPSITTITLGFARFIITVLVAVRSGPTKGPRFVHTILHLKHKTGGIGTIETKQRRIIIERLRMGGPRPGLHHTRPVIVMKQGRFVGAGSGLEDDGRRLPPGHEEHGTS